MPYTQDQLTADNPKGVIDIPRHSINAFLRMSNDIDLGEHIATWVRHLNNICELVYEDGGMVDTCPLHSAHKFVRRHIGEEAVESRALLMRELAEQGFTIQVVPADRLQVNFIDDQYILSDWSIGKLSGWVWIDQLNSIAFGSGEEQQLLEEIIRHLKIMHNYELPQQHKA